MPLATAQGSQVLTKSDTTTATGAAWLKMSVEHLTRITALDDLQ